MYNMFAYTICSLTILYTYNMFSNNGIDVSCRNIHAGDYPYHVHPGGHAIDSETML